MNRESKKNAESPRKGITYRELYAEGVQILCVEGIEEREAKLDARLLLEHVCGTSLQTFLLEGEKAVALSDTAIYRELVQRRSLREPLSYITGTRDFMGLTFEVNRDVLIPEQDTENLVEEVMKQLCGGERVLDLCTGSGCILLSLLQYSNDTVGVGTDLSEKALAVAERNAERLGLSERASWRRGDLFDAVRTEEKFDIIVSNPPYICERERADMERNVLDYEPHTALFVPDDDPLLFYRTIGQKALTMLAPGGILCFEINPLYCDQLIELLRSQGYGEVEAVSDSFGKRRFVTAK